MLNVFNRDTEEQVAIADKLHELEELRSELQELTKKKSQLQKKLRHMPTDPLTAKVLEDVSVDGRLHQTCIELAHLL